MATSRSASDKAPLALYVASETELQRLREAARLYDSVGDFGNLFSGGAFVWLRALVQRGFKDYSVPWPRYTPGEAAERFQFDFGHPQDGTAYVQSPVLPGHYLLPAVANERFVQEKVAAFVEIAEALGARNLTLTSVSMSRRSQRATADLENAAAQVGLGVVFQDDKTAHRQVLMEFAESDKPPYIPEHLGRWLIQDPILRSFVTTRLRNHRLLKAAVTLQLSESVQLAAELAAKLPKIGIKTGGEYRLVHHTNWEFEAEFWPVAGGHGARSPRDR